MGGYDNSFLNQRDHLNRNKNLIAYQDLYCGPHNWTVLHLLALFEPQSISTIPPYQEFEVSFILDKYKKTPLHYLIAHKRIDYLMINVIFEYILDYLEDNEKRTSYEYQAITDSLSPIFLFIVSKMNSNLVKRYLGLCFSFSPTMYGQVLPKFGKPLSHYSFSKTPIVQPSIQAKIHQDGQDQIAFKSLMLRFDYDITSDDMFRCVTIFSQMNNEDFFRSNAIANLIDYLWRSNKPFMKKIAFLYTALIILVSVYVVIGKPLFPLEVAILVLTSFFLISELVQLYKLGKNYFTSIWNWADIAYFALTFTIIISSFLDFHNEMYQNWMFAGMIISGYLRWISYLRLFGTTSESFGIIVIIFCRRADTNDYNHHQRYAWLHDNSDDNHDWFLTHILYF